jgi:hypothetical protein
MLISPIPTLAVDGCRVIPVDPVWAPTGVAGCEIYGEGKASWWHGEGIARNDCVWPWTACQPVKVTSLQTNRSIVVVPTMFCGCFTGTPDERIVDLDLAAVLALGLDRSEGLFPVVVESAAVGESEPPSTLPDTAAQQ